MADLQNTGFWETLQPASFQADGEVEIKFPIRGISQRTGIRMPRRPRPFRDGEKLDFTGRKAKEWTLEALFFNNVKEPDLGDAPQMWPDRLDALEAIVDLGKTGTLHLPWRRNIRCKLSDLERTAQVGERDGETARITVVEDNEDSVDAQALASVSVNATILNIVEQASFDMESGGMWDGSLEDLTELAADLEGLLNAPSEFLSDLKNKAARVKRAADSIRGSITSRLPGRNQALGPEGAKVEQTLLEIADMAARAGAQAEAQMPRTIVRTFPTDRDIFQIATELAQPVRDLMTINSEIEDLQFITAGTPVRVFAK